MGTLDAKKIKILVERIYNEHPELIPFVGGDRAVSVGMHSAEIHAIAKTSIEQYTRGENTTGFHRRGRKPRGPSDINTWSKDDYHYDSLNPNYGRNHPNNANVP